MHDFVYFKMVFADMTAWQPVVAKKAMQHHVWVHNFQAWGRILVDIFLIFPVFYAL